MQGDWLLLRKMGVQRRDTGEIHFGGLLEQMGTWWLDCSLLLELEHISLLTSQISPVAITSSSPLGPHSRLCWSSPLLTATEHRLHSKGGPSRVGATEGAAASRPDSAAALRASVVASLLLQRKSSLSVFNHCPGKYHQSTIVSGQACSSQALLLPTQDKCTYRRNSQ